MLHFVTLDVAYATPFMLALGMRDYSGWKYLVLSSTSFTSCAILALSLEHVFSSIVLGSEVVWATWYIVPFILIFLTYSTRYAHAGTRKAAQAFLFVTLCFLCYLLALKFLPLVISSSLRLSDSISLLTAGTVFFTSCIGCILSFRSILGLKGNDT